MKQALVNFGKKVGDAFQNIVDGFLATVNRLAASPIKLAGVFLLVLVAIDFFLLGSLGFIKYLMATGKSIVQIIQGVKTETLLIIILIVIFWKK